MFISYKIRAAASGGLSLRHTCHLILGLITLDAFVGARLKRAGAAQMRRNRTVIKIRVTPVTA